MRNRLLPALRRIDLARSAFALLVITALLLFAGYLLSFADHARQLFGFPFPLDYGEGPLIAQVEQLRSGTPIWQLYADPAAPPFLIINYPPVYLLLTAALADLIGSSLFAGRLIALLSTLAIVAALIRLAVLTPPANREPAATEHAAPGSRFSVFRAPFAVLPALLFLTIPIVREWAVLMRVDLPGIALGLWGLVAVRRGGVRACAVGGLLIVAGLCTKPSLVAAPLAAGGWLLWRTRYAPQQARRAALGDLLAFSATVGLGGLLVVGGLQWASSGWFWLHVVAANANRWEAGLAWDFWRAQLQLRWPLGVLAGLAVWAIASRPASCVLRPASCVLLLPLLYTLGGVITAIGVGKVGAYSNYFLELYAGLIWLIAVGAQAYPLHLRRPERAQWPVWALLAAALAFYPPLWDPDRLRPAGLIEPSPPRLAFGNSGLWADARRETLVLGALTRVHTALAADVRAAGPLIFTDLPGVAAAAGVGSRLQAFEARQLLDQGLADEHALRRELANGELPLAVIDYLGNWLTPEVIELIQRRYAHDGSWGTFDLFRPVDPGPPTPSAAHWNLAAGRLNLTAYRLAAPLGPAYEPGELLTLALRFERPAAAAAAPIPRVHLHLIDAAGQVALDVARPLLYAALPLHAWPIAAPVEHLQPLSLPADLPAGRYTLAVTVADEGAASNPGVNLTTIRVAPAGGQTFAATGHFVPAPLMAYWTAQGGNSRIGAPLTPLTPFAWGRLQCFEYACLEWRDQNVQLRNLGERLYLAETQRAPVCAAGFCPGFATAPATLANPGVPISGEVRRNGWIVQWTDTARLERAPTGGPLGLGRLGDDSLRLAPGMRYRWP